MNNNTSNTDRRTFLGQISAAGAASVAIGLEPLFGTRQAEASAVQSSNQRANECAKLRRDAAQTGLQNTPPNLQHPDNADETLYPDKLGSYSKGLPHNNDGTVVLSAYESLLQAINSGRPADFDAIPLGGDRKLTNPQSGLAFDMQGADAHSLVQPPAPAFASREQAAEISENYWMALLRDIPYSQYGANPIAHAAAHDLSLYGSDFKGAKSGGAVTTGTLFRGLTPGDKAGPYLSQYFYQDCYFGANKLEQRITTTVAGVNYMTDFATWLGVQRGISQGPDAFDSIPRYIRNGRDAGQWVHVDVLFQAYFQAFLVLAVAGAPFDEANPYANNPTQIGFGTFGGPHIATVLCEVATRALKSVWFQKWFVHRRLRPEVHAARVDRTLNHGAAYPVHPEILSSLSTSSRLGGYMPSGNSLLPMAFPEGSPTHPAYGAGHATVAGACATILKCWFNESTKLVDIGLNPVEPTADGLALVPYIGPDAGELTVGGELNKIASNVALARNTAGVHWRSDGSESLKLGEQVAINLLREARPCYNEVFSGFSLTKFDGSIVTV
ncbi:MAG TPA: vanadium-dependent haloperoxidase [Pyrinomonadaceae bacterium]